MPTILEAELKEYTHNLVADYVTYEYDRCIVFCQQHFNLMGDADGFRVPNPSELSAGKRARKGENEPNLTRNS